MSRMRHRRPSPTVLIAVLLLVAAEPAPRSPSRPERRQIIGQQTAKKALKKAKQENRNAKQAQKSANQAESDAIVLRRPPIRLPH